MGDSEAFGTNPSTVVIHSIPQPSIIHQQHTSISHCTVSPKVKNRIRQLFTPPSESSSSVTTTNLSNTFTTHHDEQSAQPNAHEESAQPNVIQFSIPSYDILGQWIAVIAVEYVEYDFDTSEFVETMVAMLEDVEPSTTTSVYALEVFNLLWQSGDNLHEELVPLIEKNEIMPHMDGAAALVSATYFMALWVASLHTTEFPRFAWFAWLGVDESTGHRLQKALLLDIGYGTPISRDEWKERLDVLLSALHLAGNPNPFGSIINDLAAEMRRVS